MPFPWEWSASPSRDGQFWHAEAQRERDARYEAEVRAKLAEERFARLVDRLVESAAAKGGATPAGGPQEATAATEAPAGQAQPAGPPEAVLAAIRRMAGSDHRTAAHFQWWIMQPEQVKRWREPRSVPGLIDEICRGKR